MDQDRLNELAEGAERDRKWERRRQRQYDEDYDCDRVINLYTCTPLPFTRRNLACPSMNKEDREKKRKMGHLQWCIKHCPFVPQADTEQPEKTIKLSEQLKGDIDETNTEVWIANDLSNGIKLVAKFFDPLYDLQTAYDPTLWAERSLAREYWCYDRLKEHQGRCVPEFYGAYLARFSLRDPSSPDDLCYRFVPLMLLQYISGSTMGEVEARKLSSAARDAVWQTLFEVDRLALALGVEQMDLGINNFILRNEDSLDTSDPELFMIDFQWAMLQNKPYEARYYKQDASMAGPKDMKAIMNFGDSPWEAAGWLID